MASACAIPGSPYPRRLLPRIASEACTGSCTSCVLRRFWHRLYDRRGSGSYLIRRLLLALLRNKISEFYILFLIAVSLCACRCSNSSVQWSLPPFIFPVCGGQEPFSQRELHILTKPSLLRKEGCNRPPVLGTASL